MSNRRRARRVSRPATCGSPLGCSGPADHVLVDPVYGGQFNACEEHWPDLVAILWAEGCWVSGCPCPECIGLTGSAS